MIQVRKRLSRRGGALAALVFLLAPAPAQAAYFLYQGQLFDASGTTPLTGSASFVIDVLSPGGSCILYEESDTAVTVGSEGYFSITVGSSTGDPKRTANDPGLTMSQIFANSLTVGSGTLHPASGGSCTGTYTAAANDVRYLQVTVTPPGGGGANLLAPNLVLGGATDSSAADTLAGLLPSQFVQVTGNTGTYTAAKAALDAVLGTGTSGVIDASAYHNHDSRYVQIGTTPQNVGSGGWYTSGVAGAGVSSAPTGTQFEVATGATTVGETIVGAAGQSADLLDLKSGGSVLASFNASGYLTLPGDPTAASQAATKNYVDNSVAAVALGYTPVNKAGDTGIGPLSLASSAAFGLGSFTTTPACSSGTAGQIWFSSGSVQYCNGSAVQTLGVSGSGIQSLNGQTGSSQTFATPTTAGSTLSWSSAANVHTLNIPMALSAGVTAGLLSNSDYTTFSGKVGGATSLTTAGALAMVSTSGLLTQAPGLAMNPTANVTEIALTAGSAQGATSLEIWQSNVGTTLYSLNSSGTPTASTDLVTKGYVTSATSSFLPLAGGTMTGGIFLGNNYFGTGNVGIGTTTPTALLNVAAGGTAAHSSPLKFTAGSKLTTPEDGAMEYDGSNYYLTIGTTRYPISLSGTGTGDFTAVDSGDGSATAPTYTFSGDSATGFYDASANGTLSLASSGANIASFSGSGTTLLKDVGIGNAPATGTGLNIASIAQSGTNAYGLQVNAPTGATNDYAAIFMGGNVGIGTTNPASALQILGTTTTSKFNLQRTVADDYAPTSSGTDVPNADFLLQNTLSADTSVAFSSFSVLNSASDNQFGYVGAVSVTGGGVYTPALVFGQSTGPTAYAERMRFDQNGRLGIGTPTPAAAVDIAASAGPSTPLLRLDGTWFIGGSGTTTKPQLLIEPTGASSASWNVNGTGLGVNAGAGFLGNLVDLQFNGVSELSVDRYGNISTTGGLLLDGFPPSSNVLEIPLSPLASPLNAEVLLGGFNLSGGNGSGTYLGINATTGGPDFVNFEESGTTMFRVTGTGALSAAGEIAPIVDNNSSRRSQPSLRFGLCGERRGQYLGRAREARHRGLGSRARVREEPAPGFVSLESGPGSRASLRAHRAGDGERACGGAAGRARAADRRSRRENRSLRHPLYRALIADHQRPAGARRQGQRAPEAQALR